MDRQQVQEIVLRVLKEFGEQRQKEELPPDIPVEVSARHVHLTERAVKQLFGADTSLTPRRPLSQPGQYLCEERVALVTSKGRIDHVAVLGPVREATQVELSGTDCRQLGIQAPLRISGDLSEAADVYIIGPKGILEARKSVIVAQAHIHMTPNDAEKYGVVDGQNVAVRLGVERRVTLERVICRVNGKSALALHVDSDEANACMLAENAKAGIKSMVAVALQSEHEKPELKCGMEIPVGCKLITEADARRLVANGKKNFIFDKDVIITPSAKDVMHHAGVEIIRQTGRRNL